MPRSPSTWSTPAGAGTRHWTGKPYVPRSWSSDPDRCQDAGLDQDTAFATKSGTGHSCGCPVPGRLSEAPQRRLRTGELAFLASGSLSRLSNVIKRCEQRGWAVRRPDPTDGRYTLAELADAGFDIVHLAAPTHLRAVRRIVLDSLNTTDQKALARIAQKLRIDPDDFG
ncbi:MarR family transcriptional regulator [Streptomyces atroolivaceus]|uniref:MarR family winged helix-turn-helix transcriptional regulator n=1 Tax=Streptomyces atroolivaceus TaxID=66869 RepID=UPI003F4E34C3